MRRVCIVVTARPSYAKWKTTMEALRARPDVELQVVVACSALLERYGRVRDVIVQDGFDITAECWTVLEGENLLTGARETGVAMSELASVYHRLRPDVVCVMADRREILAAAAAAKYQHIPVAHIQAGEKTGSIDDAVRDSVTHLSDLWFTCTDMATWRVYSLTGKIERAYWTGCGSIDMAKRALTEPPVTADELGGAGAPIDLGQPFVVVLQHAVTDEADQAHDQMWQTLYALAGVATPAVVMWPGQDAGAAGISKAIRENQARIGYHTLRSLPPSRFLRLLSQCACLVGNSSAGIRESAYLGVPVVNCGIRQFGRQRAANVIDVDHDAGQIAEAIQRQVAHGPYPSSPLYGVGNSGQRIAEVLASVDLCSSPGPQRVRFDSGQKLSGTA